MKKYLLITALVLLINLANAQTGAGVSFLHGISWNQVIQKAKAENKFIFIDCYATWCMPCKQMDAEVYPDPQVGAYMNDKFLCVKVQMDRTKEDGQEIKDWYPTAKMLYETYHIAVLPTFLYFSPSGQPMHRISGSGSVQSFIQWAKDAQDPQKQYYAILKNYQPGKLDTAELKGLASKERVTDPVLAGKLLLDYLNRGGWVALQQQHRADLVNGFSHSKDIRTWVEKVIEQMSAQHLLNQNAYKTLMIGFKKDSVVILQAIKFIAAMSPYELRDPANQSLISAYRDQGDVREKVDHYLKMLSKMQLLQKDNLFLAGIFIPFEAPKGNLFNFFVNKAEAINKATNRSGFAESVTDATLFNQVFLDVFREHIAKGDEPNWDQLFTKMKSLTDQTCATRNLADFKMKFYKLMLSKAEGRHDSSRFNWGSKASTAIVAYHSLQQSSIAVSDLMSIVLFNNDCWIIFQYSSDALELNKAANWLKSSLAKDSNVSITDTYANLLYKLGRKDEAVEWEKKAIDKDPQNKDLVENYEKMQKGLSTWPLPVNKIY